jgi:hypothetical protein
MKELGDTLVALGVGVSIAVIVSCAGAKSSQVAATSAGAEPHNVSDAVDRRARIADLDAKITAAYAQLGAGERPVAPLPVAMPTCENPPCDAVATSIKLRKDDPTCKPGGSQLCSDTCKLSDSICENAVKICGIAKELGNDAWANEKCASGTTSCDTAQTKCCGCL